MAVFILLNGKEIKPAPFDTGMITLKQPNNVTFTGRIWGDEFIYWAETQDGYRFVETFEGWYYYATLDQDGEYAPTNYKVGIDSPPASSYQLERTQTRLNEIREQIERFNEQIELNRLWYAQKQSEADAHEQPVTLKVGVILIEFQDVKHYRDTIPPSIRPDGYLTTDFDSMMFSYNYWLGQVGNQIHPEEEAIFGSFRDYWHQMSRGKLKIEGRVANPDNDHNGVPDWLTAAHSKGFYYNLTSGPDMDSLAREAIRKALIAGYVDTTNKNSPNYFDKLVIVYADIVRWGGALAVNGHKIGGKYIFLAERSSYKLHHSTDWAFTHIGVYAHEFGHNLGFWDEYYNERPLDDPLSSGYPTDIYNFCLMGFGIYNGPLSKGECPATLSAYYRIDKNWVTPTVLTTDSNNFVVEYDYYNPKYYRINPVNATNDEHFILENKKRTGFDLYIPGNPADSIMQAGRLLVWHNLVDLQFFGPEQFDRITITPADDSLNGQTLLKDFFPKQFVPNLQHLNDVTSPGAILGGTIEGESNERTAHFALNGIQKLANGNTLIEEIRLNHPLLIINKNSGGWQTVSVPHILTDYAVSSVFPTAINVYNSNYQQVNTLNNGLGYWASLPSGKQILTFKGIDVIDQIEIPVNTGWQITGSISYSIPISNVYTNPPGIINSIIYQYDGGYIPITDFIKPGVGYWVKTSTNGQLFLDKNATPNQIKEIKFSEMDKFIVSDAEGNKQTLYVSNIDIDTAVADINLDLPPMFPEMNFDSRFEYGELVKKVSANSGTVDLSILVQASSFPLSLDWEINPANGINYSFISDSGLGKISNILTNAGKASFNQLNNNKIKLWASSGKINHQVNVPTVFSLEQNYPNPFNPSTNIKFSVPKQTQLKI
ncbi:MAG: hypothetical protein Q8M94_22370, partial [Ignavibacteria bacterium]|nr:hypothetical protein [Ignavibacteria bacterium]